MESVWNKPVLTFYKERLDAPEREAFLVVKATKLTISAVDRSNKLLGSIEDFFPLMGDMDYLASERGMSDRYVLCWFDDEEDDFSRAFRRLTGVRLLDGVTFEINLNRKKIYNASFQAEKGKLK